MATTSELRNRLNMSMIMQALRELSDVQHQQRFWVDATGDMPASMTEVVARLFDESGLGECLGRGEVVFSPVLDDELRSLGSVLEASLVAQKIGGTGEAIGSPQWEIVRAEAGRLLDAISRHA